ncbi:MAG TPA: peptidoglycan-associated lipoprotein Pal [Verrucomicrobiae bacterium]|jgi:peptidoglycan-associated lipoprotein|nr:peptidoglycan-associated lipoprotein Pal [Verrucomicrobiae bacterium]
MAKLSGFWYTAIFCTFLLLQGCPKKTPPTEGAEGAGKTTTQGTNKPGDSKTKESTAEGGSLKDVREGKPPVGSGPLGEIYFAFDSFDLNPEARATLKKHADWLKSNASARAEIEGHCDDRGTNEYNLALGAKRAQAAKDYLVSLGIPAERLSTISYGEELPVCREETEDCWQKNRRDRFNVSGGKAPS